ncbi:MAG: hypothetical protein EOO29_55645, partial [Comamonadaceae bacterium]
MTPSTSPCALAPHPGRSARAALLCAAVTLVAVVAVVALGGCATRVDRDPDNGLPTLQLQNSALLTPSNGGLVIAGDDLRAGDIILSATHGINSLGIRVFTLSPVSHAALYLGDDRIIEAV